LDHKSVDFTILVVNFTILYCSFYGFTVDFIKTISNGKINSETVKSTNVRFSV
jgi:hypothetical protein